MSRPAWIDHALAAIEAADDGYFARFAPPEDGTGRQSAVMMLFGPAEDGGEDVVLTPVPDVVPFGSNVGMGEATLMDCLFTSHP